jgi:hypothetical protein
MAKVQSVILKNQKKTKKLGKHSKKTESRNKTSKNYTKAYRGQGR